jgi:hypothetical protein
MSQRSSRAQQNYEKTSLQFAIINQERWERTFPQATLALNGYSLMLIFASTYASAKSSLPLAMAPTNTAMLWVVGKVGR